MPRYTVRLRSTIEPRLTSSTYVWANDLDQAKGLARDRLRFAREFFHDGRKWDRWTIAVGARGVWPPEIVATGGIED